MMKMNWKQHRHRDYCSAECEVQQPLSAAESPTHFDKNGFCMECGVTESGISPVFSGGETRIQQEIKSLLKRLQDPSFSCSTTGPALFEGTFKRLLDQETFAAELYPGVSKGVRKDLPGNVGELMQWKSMSMQFNDMIPKMTKSAYGILQNVKEKGLARGNAMTEEEERMILPQIVQGEVFTV
jgi:hypothetical protein